MTIHSALLDLTSTAATGCIPCQERAAAAQGAHASAADAPPVVPGAAWEGVIGVEGEMTGDGRLIEKGALRWENLPIPLRYVGSDVGAHDGAVVVGRVTEISRGSSGQLLGKGDFDMGSSYGVEAARQVRENLTTGVSMDLDDVSFEVRIAADLMAEDDGLMLPLFLAAESDEEPAEPEVDADGRVTVMEIGADDEVRVTTSGRIRAATIVAIPAFAAAQITMASPPKGEGDAPAGLMPDGTTPCSCTDGDPAFDPDCDCSAAAAPASEVPAGNSVAASAAAIALAAPIAPPAAWFSRPSFTGPTALSVGKDGRISGHLATWGTCHITHTARGQCVEPPHSATGYAYFHTGAIVTAEGAEIPVGRITLDTLHAVDTASPAATLAHYEKTGTAVADVVAGEDDWGIYVVGALRPDVSPVKVRELRAAPLSGDWRRIGSNLELVAALAVNVGGFPVPRPAGLVAGGVVQSLVASGMLAPRRVRRPGTPGALSLDDLRYLKRLADRERAEEQTLKAAGSLPVATDLARRVRASSLAMRVRAASPKH